MSATIIRFAPPPNPNELTWDDVKEMGLEPAPEGAEDCWDDDDVQSAEIIPIRKGP